MQHSSVPRRPVGVAVSGNTTVVVCDDGAVFVPHAGIGPHGPLVWMEVTPIPGSARGTTLEGTRSAAAAAAVVTGEDGGTGARAGG